MYIINEIENTLKENNRYFVNKVNNELIKAYSELKRGLDTIVDKISKKTGLDKNKVYNQIYNGRGIGYDYWLSEVDKLEKEIKDKYGLSESPDIINGEIIVSKHFDYFVIMFDGREFDFYLTEATKNLIRLSIKIAMKYVDDERSKEIVLRGLNEV